MELYNAYKNARDLAWKILIDNHIYTFPVNVQKLAAQFNIIVEPSEHLDSDIFAVNLNYKNTQYIFYKQSGNENTDRFTIAHELGHILMGHMTEKVTTSYEEEQANIFASRLLAPMIVTKHNHIESAEQLAAFFGLSSEAAKIRFERYKMLEKRNKFLTSPLEREYYINYCNSAKNQY